MKVKDITEQNIYNIMQMCEQSQLSYFEYSDALTCIKFSKDPKGSTDKLKNISNTHITCTEELKTELQSDLIKIASLDQDNDYDNDETYTINSPFVGIIEYSNKIKLAQDNIILTKGEVICSVEAMKLYNDITSPVSGRVYAILVEDCSMVEYGQPILKIWIDKSEK